MNNGHGHQYLMDKILVWKAIVGNPSVGSAIMEWNVRGKMRDGEP
jgi:hypothetical protein